MNNRKTTKIDLVLLNKLHIPSKERWKAKKMGALISAEFAGPENDGPKKIKDWKMQNLENDGPNFRAEM